MRITLTAVAALILVGACTTLRNPNVSATDACGNRSYVRITAERRELLTSDTTKIVVETFSQGSYAAEVPVDLSASGGRFDGGAGPRVSIVTDTRGFGSAIWRAPSVVGLGSDARGPWRNTIEALAFNECIAKIEISVRR
jgi:hypothetical protein